MSMLANSFDNLEMDLTKIIAQELTSLFIIPGIAIKNRYQYNFFLPQLVQGYVGKMESLTNIFCRLRAL
jgi:hypothetical protein